MLVSLTVLNSAVQSQQINQLIVEKHDPTSICNN